MSDKRYEKVDRLKVSEVIEGGGIQSLRQAVRVAMTAAASGSNGIRVLDNADANLGTGNFTLHWEGALPDWTPSASQIFIWKASGTNNISFNVSTTGLLSLFLISTSRNSTVAHGIADGVIAKITASVVRETVSTAGSVTFYVNGLQLGDSVAIPAGTPTTVSNAVNLQISGYSAIRTASDTTNAIIYNRALSAAEVLSLCVNGPARADLGASQVARYTSDFSVGTDSFTDRFGSTLAGNIDGIGGEDDWLRITVASTGSARSFRRNLEGLIRAVSKRRLALRMYVPSSNATLRGLLPYWATDATADTTVSVLPVCRPDLDTVTDYVLENTNDASTATQMRFWFVPANGSINSSVTAGDVVYIKIVQAFDAGITGQWNAENAQSDTGQIFDSSGNGNHALLPAAGATVIPAKTADCKVRGKLTWTASSTAQDVVGVNQAIIPTNGVWQPTFMIRSSGSITVHIGDGSSATRYGSAVALVAGVNIVTPLLRTHDGTNRRLVITPTGSSTATINVLAKYDIVEAV